MFKFLDVLKKQIVLGDGAIGTLLYQRGQPLSACYDALNLESPDIVAQVHRDYLEAGAQLIETNTFGANRPKLRKFGLENEVTAINAKGAEIATRLAKEYSAFVAGSVGPLPSSGSNISSPSSPDELYREQMKALIDGGVDVLFLESFGSVKDLVLAVTIAKSIGSCPVIASLSFSDDGHTVDGYRINEAFGQLRKVGAEVVGLNCQVGPSAAEKLLEEMSLAEGDLVSVYPNAGRPQLYDGRFMYHRVAEYFGQFAPRFVEQGVRLLGGCCGTDPETIRSMSRAVTGLKLVLKKPAKIQILESHPAPNPEPEKPSEPNLLELAKSRHIIVTELDPPKSLSLDKMIEGAAALKKAGTDFVTMADNSLAILRVSNVATGVLIKQKTGLDPIIHLACRDRNLLGLQSELMGLNAFGLHHVLALTGDPAKVGDHPGATSIYDVNSIGLIKTIARLNEGFAANGRDLKAKSRFIIGCAFNPNARNIDSQVRKLEDKLKAGAQFVMTQPIFDPALARVTFEKTKALGVPILVGVMPLLNGRNTEFLHNEVPGIVIPDPIRERMRGKEGPEGNDEGLAVAQEICQAVLEYFKGIYLVTPLMRFDLTVHLSEHVRRQAACS